MTDSRCYVFIGAVLMMTVLPAYATASVVEIGGVQYEVAHEAVNAAVTGVSIDPDYVSLVLNVDVLGEDAHVAVSIERTLLDYGGTSGFIVLINDDIAQFMQSDSNLDRTLTIGLPLGSERVEIVGTTLGAGLAADGPAETVAPTPVQPVPVQPDAPEVPEAEAPEQMPEAGGPATADDADGVPAAPRIGLGTELAYGMIFAFIVAGIVGVLLRPLSRVRRR